MRVKICGLTRAEDAELAHNLGAWALGFIFTPQSKRQVTPDQALEIIPMDAFAVGVFVDQTDAAISIGNDLKLDGLQLHGAETPADCRKVKDNFDGVVIKAFRNDLSTATQYKGIVDYILLDSSAAGQMADWGLVQDIGIPLILAGGIRPGNIGEAAKTNPFAIDLSSGIESAPGIKDAAKMAALFEEMKK